MSNKPFFTGELTPEIELSFLKAQKQIADQQKRAMSGMNDVLQGWFKEAGKRAISSTGHRAKGGKRSSLHNRKDTRDGRSLAATILLYELVLNSSKSDRNRKVAAALSEAGYTISPDAVAKRVLRNGSKLFDTPPATEEPTHLKKSDLVVIATQILTGTKTVEETRAQVSAIETTKKAV